MGGGGIVQVIPVSALWIYESIVLQSIHNFLSI